MKKTYVFLGILFLIVSILTIVIGEIPWSQLCLDIKERVLGGSTKWNPLLDERVPRLIVLIATGASLAVSGAIMQSLFQNPLASPSVLGISCGGGLMVTMIFIFGWHIKYPYAVPLAAFCGCLMTVLVVYGISRFKGPVQLSSLILTGIAISTLLLAVQGALTYALRDRWELIQTLTEWEAGSTTDRSWKHVHMQLPLTLIGLYGCWRYRRELDILTLGEEEAINLGVDVPTVRWRLFLCVSLLTGGAIAAVGIIAFFGLVLPHLFRKLHGPSNTFLIPLCILGGSTTLVTMDVFIRYFRIHSFTIGNVSAILGGLFFLILLTKRERTASESFA